MDERSEAEDEEKTMVAGLNFCTLFDSAYLDKGIALYESMKRCTNDFHLYIYAFDDKSYEILKKSASRELSVILFRDIITDELKRVRKERSQAEFCWTCTPYIIRYTIDYFELDMCTYVDADLFFYSNPQVLIKEMLDSKSSVQIVEHRYPGYWEYERMKKRNGIYCVQFNTFKNDINGRRVLKWWEEQCLLCCSDSGENGTFGDQKYLDCWTEKFEGVQVLQHCGGGVAPWNIAGYRLVGEKDRQIILEQYKSKKTAVLVFYHFHDFKYIDSEHVNVNIFRRPGYVEKKLFEKIYFPYIKQIERIREDLKRAEGYECPSFPQKERLLWEKGEERDWKSKIITMLLLPLSFYRIKRKGKKDIICTKNVKVMGKEGHDR